MNMLKTLRTKMNCVCVCYISIMCLLKSNDKMDKKNKFATLVIKLNKLTILIKYKKIEHPLGIHPKVVLLGLE